MYHVITRRLTGILTKTQSSAFLPSDSELSLNGESGLHFNPFLSLREQREMTGWLKLISSEYTAIPGAPATITLDKDRPVVLITKTIKNGASQEQTITFTVRDGRRHIRFA